ncbi:Molybdopterin-converting factor subunit 2 [Sugiyamaella lignohabitans]|uniref:Molybdopterin synthase catalytic subunit n=1 Tax=Sugiyamaella lignohabitans TaxID=796027 RepID=A0A167FLS2_9ASCO|nr:Molybdopterin-converting factor subunit 2 [Sugiyamaella lignohabitans]ANB15461.1 Molybdopterin-converting factor subunit 2 [Sugiyamaella lignohabitans]
MTVEDCIQIALTEDPLDPLELINFVRTPRAGAIVYFGGITRDNMDGKQVVHLSYEAYKPLAIKTLNSIASKALEKWNIEKNHDEYICKVAIVHRLGEVPIGEESVIIAVSAGHRKEGWAAGEWILERVKESVEIWKNERYADGTGVWKANDGHRPHQHTA